jgi:hypothetical protein
VKRTHPSRVNITSRDHEFNRRMKGGEKNCFAGQVTTLERAGSEMRGRIRHAYACVLGRASASACAFLCTCVHLCVCTRVRVCLCPRVLVRQCVCAHVRVCASVCACACVVSHLKTFRALMSRKSLKRRNVFTTRTTCRRPARFAEPGPRRLVRPPHSRGKSKESAWTGFIGHGLG